MDKVTGVFKWPFMNEPLYRWFAFLIAITLFSAVWARVLGYMKD